MRENPTPAQGDSASPEYIIQLITSKVFCAWLDLVEAGEEVERVPEPWRTAQRAALERVRDEVAALADQLRSDLHILRFVERSGGALEVVSIMEERRP